LETIITSSSLNNNLLRILVSICSISLHNLLRPLGVYSAILLVSQAPIPREVSSSQAFSVTLSVNRQINNRAQEQALSAICSANLQLQRLDNHNHSQEAVCSTHLTIQARSTRLRLPLERKEHLLRPLPNPSAPTSPYSPCSLLGRVLSLSINNQRRSLAFSLTCPRVRLYHDYS
jgi:hypothetical protein